MPVPELETGTWGAEVREQFEVLRFYIGNQTGAEMAENLLWWSSVWKNPPWIQEFANLFEPIQVTWII